jgi:hypothetical protein
MDYSDASKAPASPEEWIDLFCHLDSTKMEEYQERKHYCLAKDIPSEISREKWEKKNKEKISDNFSRQE